MTDYNWAEYPIWRERYPPDTHGRREWRRWLETAAIHEPPRLPPWLWSDASSDSWPMDSLLRRARPRPRVFVSHNQADAPVALRFAQMATDEGFEFWLDVLDPGLTGLAALAPTTPANHLKSTAIAAIIEMALINSSHVLAVITRHTWASRWIPYEYGRVKDDRPVSLQAGCWVDPCQKQTLPEYLRLGAINRDGGDVRRWLRHQLAEWTSRWGP